MVTSDHADLSRASSIASHVPRCTKLSLPAVDCLLQVEDLCREPDAAEVQSMLADLLAKLES